MTKILRRDVVALASQRPAYPTFPAAITRHMVFRIPEQRQPHLAPTPESPHAKDTRWRDLLTPINDFIRASHAGYGTSATKLFRIDLPGAADEAIGVERVPASESILCHLNDARPGTARARLRIDVHTEFFTITQILDQADGGCDLGRAVRTACEIDEPAPLYDDIWAGRLTGDDGRPFWKGPTEPLPDCYAEFRGLILAAPPRAIAHPGEEPLTPPASQRSETTLTDGIREFLTLRQKLVRRVAAHHEEASDGAGAIAPPDGNITTDTVACGMLGGRALYASALASRRGVVRYLVAYDGVNSSQLGRFIRRLHTMGELRIAALIDLSDHGERNLRRVGQRIRRLGVEVDEALKSKAPLTADEVATLSRSHVEASDLVEGGVIYRVERSHYYAASLLDRLSDLRIVRIEGWQPYDAFIRRYHSQDYEFIAGVGRRYRALGQRIDRLMFLHQSQRAEANQAAVLDLVGSLQDQGLQEAQQTSNSVKSLRKLVSLQDRAEDIALIAALYYGSQTLKYSHLLSDVAEQKMMYVAGIIAIALLVDTFFFRRFFRRLISRALRPPKSRRREPG